MDDEKFPYLEFFDIYPFANDYDILAKKLVGCHIFDSYLLKNPVNDYCICYSTNFNGFPCECYWACIKLLKNKE